MKSLKQIPLLVTSLILAACSSELRAQKIDNIVFNLYTDSLKKGTYNYINVDGKLSNGSWLPLTQKEIRLTSTAGSFEGNSLFIDKDFKPENVSVTAVLISDTTLKKSVTIFVKKKEDTEKLKTAEEILREMENKGPKRKKN